MTLLCVEGAVATETTGDVCRTGTGASSTTLVEASEPQTALKNRLMPMVKVGER